MTTQVICFSGEDDLSEALASRCVKESLPNFIFHSVRPGQGGNVAVKDKFSSYAKSAIQIPFLVMLDQDDFTCPPSLRSDLLNSAGLTDLPARMVLSVVTRESEAWLLGDRSRLAAFLEVDIRLIPDTPEDLGDSKGELVKIAKRSRRHNSAICPKVGVKSKVGPRFNDVLSQFVHTSWRPDVAAESCLSLRRTLQRLRSLEQIGE